MRTKMFRQVVEDVARDPLELADTRSIRMNDSELTQALVVASHRLYVI